MTVIYSGVAGNISSPNVATPSVLAPADGDPDNAATFAVGLQGNTDMNAMLLRLIQGMALENATISANAPNANDFATSTGLATNLLVAILGTGTTSHWSTSLDYGKTWTFVVSGVAETGYGVVWFPVAGLYVAVVVAGGVCAIETMDSGGATVTPRAVPTTAAAVPCAGNCIATSASLIVAAVGNTGQVIFSTNGTTWSAQGAAVMTGKVMTQVIFAQNQFVAVSTDSFVFTSPNGTTWTAQGQASSTGTGALQGLAFNARLGLYILSNGTTVPYATSPNAITWTPRSGLAGTVVSRVSTCWGLFVAVASTGPIQFYISSDGLTWTAAGGPPGLFAPGGMKQLYDRLFYSSSATTFASLAVPNL